MLFITGLGLEKEIRNLLIRGNGREVGVSVSRCCDYTCITTKPNASPHPWQDRDSCPDVHLAFLGSKPIIRMFPSASLRSLHLAWVNTASLKSFWP